jgi:archaellum component FlaC
MDLSHWASIAQIVSVSGGVLFGLWKIWRKIDIHQANSAARSDVMESRLDRIEKQFGPNGGGLREAVNRMSDTIYHMDKKIDNVTKEVSELKGEFHQHLREEQNG